MHIYAFEYRTRAHTQTSSFPSPSLAHTHTHLGALAAGELVELFVDGGAHLLDKPGLHRPRRHIDDEDESWRLRRPHLHIR